MALARKIVRLSINPTRFNGLCLRNKSITGYKSADTALQTVTGGKIYRWLDAYEDFVGLTEVRHAQESVTEAETNYRQIQEERRSTQHKLSAVQSKIKTLAKDIEKTNRGTDAYLDLVMKENEIIKEEKQFLDQLTSMEENEKSSFSTLSSALRESHEKERARAERMKYWGIMGSVIGAIIGIFGTTVNNHLRMKELRNIVSSSVDTNKLHREQTLDLINSVNKQYEKTHGFLIDIKSHMGLPASVIAGKHNIHAGTESALKIEDLVVAVKRQEHLFEQEMTEVRKILAASAMGEKADIDGNVAYVGPELRTMLKETEKSLEWKMKMQALGTVTLIYAAAAVSVPIIIKIFTGGS